MARINANTQFYPEGGLVDSGPIPGDVNFIILEAADLARGNWNWAKPADCVNPQLGAGGVLDQAYAMGMPVLLRFTIQIDWMNFKPDFENPANDKQLRVFKKALEGKKPGISYIGFVFAWTGAESEGNQEQTIRFYADQVRDYVKSLPVVGRELPVFIECRLAQWESMPHLLSMIGQAGSPYSLLITHDYESWVVDPSKPKQAAIETPGNWSLTAKRSLIWKYSPAYRYKFWEETASFKSFFGMNEYLPGSGGSGGDVDDDEIPPPPPVIGIDLASLIAIQQAGVDEQKRTNDLIEVVLNRLGWM